MDIFYLIALLLFIALVCILLVSIRNLLRLKGELKEMMGKMEDRQGAETDGRRF